MRFIPTRIHAILDYVAGFALLVIPMAWLEEGSPAVMVPMIAGAVILLQALFTDFEISIANIIPMPAHLMMDALLGIVVLASPWLFGFYEIVWLPHVLVGLIALGSAAMTHLHRGVPEITSTHGSGHKHAV